MLDLKKYTNNFILEILGGCKDVHEMSPEGEEGCFVSSQYCSHLNKRHVIKIEDFNREKISSIVLDDLNSDIWGG